MIRQINPQRKWQNNSLASWFHGIFKKTNRGSKFHSTVPQCVLTTRKYVQSISHWKFHTFVTKISWKQRFLKKLPEENWFHIKNFGEKISNISILYIAYTYSLNFTKKIRSGFVNSTYYLVKTLLSRNFY